MTMVVTTAMLLNWLRRSAALIHAQCDVLTRLDAVIGDADHGVNLDRGFIAVVSELPVLAGCDAGHILQTTGIRLISTVGGASGSLYGTAFHRAGVVLEQRYTVTKPELIAALHAFVSGIKQIGQVEIGQKTMLDALHPALATLDALHNQDTTLAEAFEQVALAADAGAESTIPLQAQRGRASYLHERSAGHKDPGAASAALIMHALAETLIEAECKQK